MTSEQLHVLAEAGMQQGMPFKVTAEGALYATDENVLRRKMRTLRNHGTVDSSSVSLESVMVPGQGVRYALKFQYSASEDMNVKVFFHAKDVDGKLAIRSKLDGVKKWEDIVLPAGKDMTWDSATAGRLFLCDDDPVFLRLRALEGENEEQKSKSPYLYDMVIVLSFVNNSSLFSSDEQRVSESMLSPSTVEPPQYSMNPMKSDSTSSLGTVEGLDSGDIELKSGRVGDMKKRLSSRWADAKQSMLQGFAPFKKDNSPAKVADSSPSGSMPPSGSGSEFVTCEKTRCRLLALPSKDWIPPPAKKKANTVFATASNTKGLGEEDTDARAEVRMRGDRFGSLRSRYSLSSIKQAEGLLRAEESDDEEEEQFVRGPRVQVECISQALLYNDEEYLSKEVYGGTWDDLCPSALPLGDDEDNEVSAIDNDASDATTNTLLGEEAKDDTRKPDETEEGKGEGGDVTVVVDFRKSGESKSMGELELDFDDDNYQDSYCVICMSAPRQVIVHPCNHCCCCSGCATVLSSDAERISSNRNTNSSQIKCPMCRVPVTAMIYLKDKTKQSWSSLPPSVVMQKGSSPGGDMSVSS